MRYALVSDIHANWQAWEATLSDIRKQNIDSILCLGDVIGYGPRPAETLKSAYENVDHFVLGNHDAVVAGRMDANLFNDNAKRLIEWTQDQLNPEAVEFFAEMPLDMEGENFHCGHGEIAIPGRFAYIYEVPDAIESFDASDKQLLFVGHTHRPGFFIKNRKTGQITKHDLQDFSINPDMQYLINVGSVGDPRDGSMKSTYVIYDDVLNAIYYRQLDFDIEAFKRDLNDQKLNTSPTFLKVYEGGMQETHTLRGIKVDQAQVGQSNVAQLKEPKKKKFKIDKNTSNKKRAERSFRAKEGGVKNVKSSIKSKSGEKETPSPIEVEEDLPKKNKLLKVLLFLLAVVIAGGIFSVLEPKSFNKLVQQVCPAMSTLEEASEKKLVVPKEIETGSESSDDLPASTEEALVLEHTPLADKPALERGSTSVDGLAVSTKDEIVQGQEPLAENSVVEKISTNIQGLAVPVEKVPVREGGRHIILAEEVINHGFDAEKYYSLATQAKKEPQTLELSFKLDQQAIEDAKKVSLRVYIPNKRHADSKGTVGVYCGGLLTGSCVVEKGQKREWISFPLEKGPLLKMKSLVTLEIRHIETNALFLSIKLSHTPQLVLE